MSDRTPLAADERGTSGLDQADTVTMPPADGGTIPLPQAANGSTPFRDLIASRRSIRPTTPCSFGDVLAVLSYLHLPAVSWVAADGYRERQTPTPSAGGRHPLSLIVFGNTFTDHAPGVWAISPADEPALAPIGLPDRTVSEMLAAAGAALRADQAPPVLIVAVARSRRTLSKYPWGDSLLWRDAGALLTTAHLASHDLGLESTLVGTSDTITIPLAGTDEHVFDVGALALGGRTHTVDAPDH